MTDIDMIYWDPAYTKILSLNLGIIIALFASLRLFSGTMAHANASDELFIKDNPAFGISMSGVALGITIMLSGTIYGDPARSIQDTVIAVGLYGLIGIVLMAVTRIIFDKFAFPQILIRQEILKGNVAAAILDAGNVIATAVIIRAVMMWIPSNTVDGMLTLFVGFLLFQILLTAASILRLKILSMRHDTSFQDQVIKGNIAIALRFTGKRISSAFAITAASYLIVYESYGIYILLPVWACISVGVILLLSLLAAIADRVIFFGVNYNDEVINQRNIAVGLLQGIIYISLGLLLTELMI